MNIGTRYAIYDMACLQASIDHCNFKQILLEGGPGMSILPSLQRRIRDYYGQYWLRQAEESDEAELLQELPHTLRTEALWAMSRK